MLRVVDDNVMQAYSMHLPPKLVFLMLFLARRIYTRIYGKQQAKELTPKPAWLLQNLIWQIIKFQVIILCRSYFVVTS